MMPVMKIVKKRAAKKSSAPGLWSQDANNKITHRENSCAGTTLQLNTNNNVSTRQPQTSPIYGDIQSKDFPSLRVNRERINHMMPVIEVSKRRSQNHSKPPGFTGTLNKITDTNTNNSAKGWSKIRKAVTGQRTTELERLEHFETARRLSRIRKRDVNIDYEMKNSKAVSKHLNSDEKRVVKYRSSIHAVPKKTRFIPNCFQTNQSDSEDNKHSGKNMKKRKKKKEDYGNKVKVVHTADDICGDYVVVNVIYDDEEDGEFTFELDARRTPENYAETYHYFEHINENRRDIFRALYTLGDMLMVGKLEGDDAEWGQYIQQAEEEENAWKDKCQRSKIYFEKTRKILGQSRFDKARAYLRRLDYKLSFWLQDYCQCCFLDQSDDEGEESTNQFLLPDEEEPGCIDELCNQVCDWLQQICTCMFCYSKEK